MKNFLELECSLNQPQVATENTKMVKSIFGDRQHLYQQFHRPLDIQGTQIEHVVLLAKTARYPTGVVGTSDFMMGSKKYCNGDKARFTTKIHKVKSETVGWLHIFWDQSYVCLHPAPELIVWRHFCERFWHSSDNIWAAAAIFGQQQQYLGSSGNI